MFDNKELRYISGEMDDAEMRAYEMSLDAESAKLTGNMKAAFGDLRKLRDDIPECQLTTAHLWNAIESKPAVQQSNFNWKPVWFGVPVAAGLLVMALMYKPGSGSVDTPTTNMVAKVDATTPLVDYRKDETPSIDNNVAMNSAPRESVSAPSIPVPAPSVPSDSPRESAPLKKSGKKKRSNRPRLPAGGIRVADTRFDTASAAMSMAAPMTKASAADQATVAAFGTMESGSPAMGRGTAGPMARVGNPGAPVTPKVSEPVVIVSSSESEFGGTSTAVEVQNNDNLVIGG